MQNFLRIGMVFSVLLASSCSAPVKMSAPPAPWRVCGPGEDPAVTGCRKEQPAAAITIRGHNDR